MPVYGCDVKIAGTAYVKAQNQKEAKQKLAAWIEENGWIEVEGDDISNSRYDDPELPEVSFSGSMTLKGVYTNAKFERRG